MRSSGEQGYRRDSFASRSVSRMRTISSPTWTERWLSANVPARIWARRPEQLLPRAHTSLHSQWTQHASGRQRIVNELEKFSFLVDGLDHPEGVAWGPDGKLYAGGEAGQLYRVDVDAGSYEQIASTGGFLLGVALDGRGYAYACDLGRQEVVRIGLEGGEVDVYSKGAPDAPPRSPNWPVFDRGGNLYVSDSGTWKGNDGLIFKVASGGETTVWSREATNF